MGIVQDIYKEIEKRKKIKDIREIQMKTEINMKVWENEHKKESFWDKIWRWLR